METALVASKTFVLGLKIHCKGCENKVKKRMQCIQGVHTVAIDSKKGRITITGTIDPPTLISILEKYSIKAELIWEDPPPPSEDSISSRSSVNGHNSTADQNMEQILSGSKLINQFDDPEMVRTLQQLSGGNTEVTVTKTVKVVFDGGNMKVVEATSSITTGRNEKGVMNNDSIPAREENTVIGTPYLVSGGQVQNIQGNHHCRCQFCGHMHNHDHHWPPPPAQPWPSTSTSPSAPPYQSMFSDDNVNGCVII